MTTKPKAKKFRIRKGGEAKPGGDAAASGQTPFSGATDDGLGKEPFETAKPKATIEPVESNLTPEEAIDQIRREGLTGRQLRMARRVAQKQGLSPISDYDAVRLLRAKGIDPFKRSNMLELVVTDAGSAEPAQPPQPAAPASTPPQDKPSGSSNLLPSTITAAPAGLPSTEVVTENTQASDIMSIQRDIARRRRRRAALLLTRLVCFVFLPTLVAGYYYFFMATPMYATKSEFVIQTAEPSGGGQLGGLFSGTGLATSQDSIAVQGYLQSLDVMLRLDEDEGFRGHFSQPGVDPLQRIELDSSNADAYKLFKRYVKIGYDPTEGIMKMEVSAADPKVSESFSNALLSYAEQRVDQLTARLRDDQMEGAEASRVDAALKMQEAQERIVNLQERLGVLSPENEVQAVFGQISQLEGELLTERLSLRQYLSNSQPNRARVSAAENKIAELEFLIKEKRAQLTESNANSGSLARVSAELLVAQADLQTRQSLLAQAEAQFEAARLEANRQVRYLSIGVSPIAPDEPTYPRAFENTVLAFLIFAGIYLMVSLTASILREQV